MQAGILEPSEASKVRDAIVTDSSITERQKQVLLDIYTSFCQQNEAEAEADADVDAPADAGVEQPPTAQSSTL